MKKKRTGISANITRRTEMPDAKHAIERGKTSKEKRTDSSSLLGDRVLSTSQCYSVGLDRKEQVVKMWLRHWP